MSLKSKVSTTLAAVDVAKTLVTGQPQSLPEQAAEVQQQQQEQRVEQHSVERQEAPTTQEPPKNE